MHSELPNTVLLGQEGDFGNKRVSKELWHEDIPEQGDLGGSVGPGRGRLDEWRGLQTPRSLTPAAQDETNTPWLLPLSFSGCSES